MKPTPLISADDAEHTGRVQVRSEELRTRAAEISRSVQAVRLLGDELKLLDVAAKASSASARLVWLRRASDVAVSAVRDLSTCRPVGEDAHTAATYR